MASLNTKILGGLGALLAGAALMATTAIVTESKLGDAVARSARSAELLRQHMQADMMHDALRADAVSALASRDPSSGVKLEDTRKDIDEHLAAFAEAIAKARGLADDAETRAVLSELDAPLSAYGQAARNMVEAVATAPDSAGSAMAGFRSQFETLETAMEAASEKIEAVARADAAATRRLQETARMVGLGALGLLILLAVGLAYLARRTISGPLADVTRALDRLTAGDLAVRAPHAGRDDEIGHISKAVDAFRDAVAARQAELQAADQREALEAERQRGEALRREVEEAQAAVVGDLATGLGRLAGGDLSIRLTHPFPSDYEKLRLDFNAAAGALADALAGVSTVATAIRSGSDEISIAADDLARRTEHQAASLEQTAATLDQITTNVKKTAAGATQARGYVTTAADDAEAGARIVQDAVNAMDRIRASSDRIGQIIGVIDEIAFQTNLLALNAGVEAARAGETGRGFAVVASEVRALAQRSAGAAKEIKTLIDASSGEVAEGVDLVGRTGEALHRLAGHVHQINTVVADIAASAQEQSAGLHEINSVVNQMDQVTQQNAAMVEETTAASHSLSREAEQLGAMMQRFRLGEAAAPAAPRPVARPRAVAAAGGAAGRAAPALDAEGWEDF